MTDAFDQLVALRPPVPDEQGWATSAAGRAALARVHHAAPRPPWWKRGWFVVPTIGIGIGVAIGGGVAFAPADRQASSDGPVVCVDHTADGSLSYAAIADEPGVAHDEIVAQCNAQRVAMGKPTPADYAECVVPVGRGQVGGAEAAIPSAVTVNPTNHAAVCQAAGFDPGR